MNGISKRIKAAKPEAPALPTDFSAVVLSRIEKEGLSILPASRGVPARRIRLALAIAMLTGGVLLANGSAFEIRMNGSLELLYFRFRFLGEFLTGLPFDLLVSALLLSGIAAWFFHHARLARLALVWVVLITFGLTSVGGAALAESGLNERIQEWTLHEENSWPVLGRFYRERARFRMRLAGFRMGQVKELSQGSARILTPTGETISIILPPGLVPRVGDHVRLSGAESGGRFQADGGQLCDPRRTMRYFRHMGMNPEEMRKNMNEHMRRMPGMRMGPGGMMRGGRGMGMGMSTKRMR